MAGTQGGWGALTSLFGGKGDAAGRRERRAEADANTKRGEQLAAAGRYGEAMSAFDAALAIEQEHYHAAFGRAKALMEVDRNAGMKALAAVCVAFPNKLIPYKRRFEALFLASRYVEALAVLDEAERHLPDEPRIGEMRDRVKARRAQRKAAELPVSEAKPASKSADAKGDRPSKGDSSKPPIFPRSFQTAATLNDYLPFFRSSVNALERQALRERSWRTRELLALTASDGVLGYPGLLDMVRSMPAEALGPALATGLGLGGFRSKALVALARVVASQELDPRDAADSRAIYRFVKQTQPAAMRDIDWIQLLLLPIEGNGLADAYHDLRVSGLAEKDPVDFALLLSNLMQADAIGGGQAGFSNNNLFALNTAFRQAGLEGIRILDENRPLATLQTDPLDHVVTDGPLVSVLMTTFNADHSIELAMRSVLGQSWRNLELIVIDDCSEPDSFATVKAWEARDPRVRVLRNERNQGTYVSKNRGLAEARGEFVTCHDSDDWSHARKIQYQVESLVTSGRIAGIGQWVRCSPQLRFEMFSGGGTLAYQNLSSLMYRRAPIAEKIGFYDSVRTGADSEFKRRIELAYGESAIDAGRLPLSFGQVHSMSLTANSLGRGWFSPDRLAYRSAWNRWHDTLRESGGSTYVAQAEDRTKFAVVNKLLPDRETPVEGVAPFYDVVMISDFRMAGGNTVSAAEEIKAQAQAGLRTAICQVGAFRKGFMHREFIDPRMQDLVSQGLVDRIDLGDRVDAGLVTIRYPAVFQFAEGAQTGIKADRVIVVMNQPPSENDSRDRRYDLVQSARNIECIFGVPQMWTPIGPVARDAVTKVMGEYTLSDRDWFNVIDLGEWSGPRDGLLGPEPIIGRHSRDDYSKWPNSAEALLAAYPETGDFRVRILGGAEAVQGIVGRVPAAWQVFEFGSISPREFLEGIDFFVFFHHPERVEAFGRTIIEAMASGCVAILPRSFEPLMKESALYCEPHEVQDIVRRLHGDPEAFRAQSRRAFDYVRTNFGYDAHIQRLQSVRRGDGF